ncbi:unnamed protein product [Leptidea sinapis]|uniref:Uncharacterized protein n=1 Tax=Leptidea sinapis TaxID=189913 RepID=A0A5E4PP40_9NEOP|nr:unnamed protein product [Leptidea sinapis]
MQTGYLSKSSEDALASSSGSSLARKSKAFVKSVALYPKCLANINGYERFAAPIAPFISHISDGRYNWHHGGTPGAPGGSGYAAVCGGEQVRAGHRDRDAASDEEPCPSSESTLDKLGVHFVQ